MHYSVGALIEREGTYLLLDRKNIPYGWAGPAGHVDEGESPEGAMRREVQEETGLIVESCTLVCEEEVQNNQCGRGVATHYWYVYRCFVRGEAAMDEREAKAMDWFTPEAIARLQLEPVWEYWFEKLEIL